MMAEDMQSLARKLIGPLWPWIVDRIPIQVGTFTPTFVGSTIAGTFTYTAQNGQYIRLGNMVFVTARIAISAISVAPTGNLQLGGLPFTSATPNPGTLNLSDYTGFTLGAGYSQLGARMSNSATTALLIKSGSAIQAVVLAGGALALRRRRSASIASAPTMKMMA